MDNAQDICDALGFVLRRLAQELSPPRPPSAVAPAFAAAASNEYGERSNQAIILRMLAVWFRESERRPPGVAPSSLVLDTPNESEVNHG